MTLKTLLKSSLFATFTFFSSPTLGWAGNCDTTQMTSGLIFDAAAYPVTNSQERYLDKALTLGVEKVVFFAPPVATNDISLEDLEAYAPDLVLQGQAPWSQADPVHFIDTRSDDWQNALSHDGPKLIAPLTAENRDAVSLAAQSDHQLYIGIDDDLIQRILAACAQGEWSKFLRAHDQKIVYTSLGSEESWRYYGFYTNRLRKAASLLDEDLSLRLMHKNAETLYEISVNAP